MSEHAPIVVPEPGWRPITTPVKTPRAPAFLRGGPAAGRLRVAWFERDDGAVVGRVWFGPGTEGPPGHAHGGSIAAVLDEAMGAAVWHAGHPVVAANLSVDFRRMLPLGTDATFECHITSIEGRKVRTRGRLLGSNGELFAEGAGLYVMLTPEQAAMLG
ncbi:MAG: hypothetical protein AMXMBFR64_31920 [Myxococcales bacterium]